MRKIFSVPLNPKLNPEQYKTYCEVLLEHKDYIKDIYFTSRIPPFMQDAMGDVFVYKEDYDYYSGFSGKETNYKDLPAYIWNKVVGKIQCILDKHNMQAYANDYDHYIEMTLSTKLHRLYGI